MTRLTQREQEVLRLLIAGRTSKGIALDLGLKSDTVRDYTFHLRLKLGAATLPQAVAKAIAAGLV